MLSSSNLTSFDWVVAFDSADVTIVKYQFEKCFLSLAFLFWDETLWEFDHSTEATGQKPLGFVKMLENGVYG